MAYAVVKFVNEGDALAVIHKNWLTGDQSCLWPPGPCHGKLLRSGIVDPAWETFTCCVMTRTDNLADAKKKIRKLEACESDTEQERPRLRRKRRMPSSDEEDLVEDNPLPPELSNLIQVIGEYSSVTKKKTQQQVSGTDQRLENSSEIIISKLDEIIEEVQKQKNQTQMLEKILLQQEEMKKEISMLRRNQGGKKDLVNLSEVSKMFPLTTVKEFNEVESILKTDDDEQERVVKWLTFHMGADLEDSTYNCLKSLLSDEILPHVNWTGKQSSASIYPQVKLSLKDSAIFSVIILALQNQSFVFNVKQVTEHTKTWLRRAYDRTHKLACRRSYKENQLENLDLVEDLKHLGAL